MALTINNDPQYTLTTKGGQRFNILPGALNAQNLIIRDPDGNIIENPDEETLQQIRDYIDQVNQNKPYIDAQGTMNVPEGQQAEINPAEKVNPVSNAINQYFRGLNYELSNGVPLSGKYAVPGILLGGLTGGAFLQAPLTFGATMAGGYVGDKVFDSGIKLATGKSWADNVHDWTGLDREPAKMTNPGVWIGGGAPLASRSSRTLLSAGDQIVTDAARDILHYGPRAIIRNPEGWYRPYVDQVKNGWQGWKDAKLAYKNNAIRSEINQPYFESFTKRNGIYTGSNDLVGEPFSYKNVNFYNYPEYQEGIGRGIYGRWKLNGKPLYAVTQQSEMPNTYLFHIGSGGKRGMLDGASQMTLGRMRVAIPKYSYMGETATPSTGQIGMSFITQNNRTPILGELIKSSKMSTTKFEPLSANSTNMLLSGKNGMLRYTNEYMSNFNNQSLIGSNSVTKELINSPSVSTINNFLKLSNPKARPAFIGLDGQLRIPIPINFKI